MKKILAGLALLPALLAFGCVTTGGSQNDGHAWVSMSQSDLENRPEYKGTFVFKESTQGLSLMGVQTWAEEFNVASQVSKLVATRIKAKFSGALVGSVDGADTYFEKMVNSVSSADISGWRKEDSYSKKTQITDADGKKKDGYAYYILITIPTAEVKKAVARAFDQNPPANDNETKARDRVKKTMDETEEW